MNEQEKAKEAIEGAERAAAEEGRMASARIRLEKNAGDENFEISMEASSASAMLNGIAVLIRRYAEEIGMSVGSVLAILATVMLGKRGTAE